MLRSFVFLTLMVTVSAAASCGSDTRSSATDSVGSAGGVTTDEACAAYASAVCAKLNTCSSFFLSAQYGDEASCKSRFALECPPSIGAPGSNMTAARWKECADAVPAVACDDIFERNIPDACKADPGTFANGAACGNDSQCKSARCKLDGKECGVCAERGALGGACKSESDCDWGLACATDKCVKPGDAGATCDDATPCRNTLACSGGKCAERAIAGEACDAQSQNCDTTQGLGCNSMGVCQKLKLVGPGEVCGVVGMDFVGCTGGGKCKTDMGGSGTCLAPAADGEACDDTAGPPCLQPATCVSSVCKLSDPAACK